jgi:cob(I)alamin adenosyltransferase
MSDDLKTTFLVTDESLDGWKIEDILMTIQNDMFWRTQKIVGDSREEARDVLNNNIKILGLLSQCIEKATESTRILNRSFGPHKDGKPRIGVA